jgi:hypothetical protein
MCHAAIAAGSPGCTSTTRVCHKAVEYRCRSRTSQAPPSSRLQLDTNGLKGSISIGKLTGGLVYLDLHDNQLTGSVPSTIGQLMALGTLGMGRTNHLTGSVPQEMLQLKQLLPSPSAKTSLLGSCQPSTSHNSHSAAPWTETRSRAHCLQERGRALVDRHHALSMPPVPYLPAGALEGAQEGANK